MKSAVLYEGVMTEREGRVIIRGGCQLAVKFRNCCGVERAFRPASRCKTFFRQPLRSTTSAADDFSVKVPLTPA